MALQFASGRSILSTSDWSISVTTGGNLSASSFYLSLQGRNIIGKNQLLISDQITVEDNDQVIITINPSALQSGEDWYFYCIGISSTNIETSFNQLALIPLYSSEDQLLSFPLTLTLSEDDQLTTGNSTAVATPELLPVATRLNGMRRKVNSTGRIYEYDQYSTRLVDDDFVLSASLHNGLSGRWLYTGTYSTYISTVYEKDGSSQDVRYMEEGDAEKLYIPDYAMDGSSSKTIAFWITNGTGGDIDAGKLISLDIRVGGLDKSKLFDNRIYYAHNGYVNLSTGVRRTTLFSDINTELEALTEFKPYRYSYPSVILPDVLKNNEAIEILIYLQFNSYEIDGELPNTYISVYPRLVGTVGVYNPQSSLFKDQNGNNGIIYNDFQFRRLVPNLGLLAFALAGKGNVQGYDWTIASQNIVAGFAVNTDNQKVLVNKNGTVYYHSLLTNPSDSLLRALISTLPVESKISDAETVVLDGVSETGLTVTVSYPVTPEGYGVINPLYDDVIAGTSLGKFNPINVNIYITNGSAITKKYTTVITPDESAQSIIISDWTSAASSSLPASTETLYVPPSASSSLKTNIGDFPADTYTIRYSYEWDGNQISGISHKSVDGCIYEAVANYQDVFSSIPTKDGDYGDITVSNANTVWRINNDSVSLAKLENASASSVLLGRGDSGTGDYQEITLGENIEIVGTTLNVTGGSGGQVGLTENVTWYAAPTNLGTGDGLSEANAMAFDALVKKVNETVDNGYSITLVFTDGTYPTGDAIFFEAKYNLYLQKVAGSNPIIDGELRFSYCDYVEFVDDIQYTATIYFFSCMDVYIYGGTFTNNLSTPLILYGTCMYISGTFNLSGTNKYSFIQVGYTSQLDIDDSTFNVISGTCNWTGAFIDISQNSSAEIYGTISSSGTFTGKKYNIENNGYLSGDTSNIPASLDGTVDNKLGLSTQTVNELSFVKNKLDATTDPVSTNDTSEGYSVGSKWFNITDDKIFECIDNTDNAAIWINISQSGLSDGDKGDITVSGSGSTLTIDNDSVTTAKIADNNVTLAKLADSSASSILLGRGDAGTGDYQELTLGANISITGTTINVSSGTATIGDADYGDITVSSSGTVWTADNNAIISKVLTGFTASTATAITATDSLLQALQKQQAYNNAYLTNFNGVNQLVQLDGSGRLPAIDGSQLTNLPSGGGAVDSVNSQTGVVVLDADDIDDSTTTHKFISSAELAAIASNTSAISNKQDTLVSGTNIKTINSESLLGSGNIEISGGSGSGGVGLNLGTWDSSASFTSGLDFGTWNTDSKILIPQVTTVNRSGATLTDGELVYDTDEQKFYYGDGVTVGGIQVGSGSGSGSGREVLTADRTYYVNASTGNDNNNGLTSENAFATIQKAVDVVCSLDNSVYQPTIQITGNFLITQPIELNDYIGSKPPIILGDVVNPTNSSVSATTGFSVPSTSIAALFSCNANKWIIKGVAGFGYGNAVYGFSVYAFGSQNFSTLYLENCLIKSNSSLGFGLKVDLSTLIIVTKLKIDATNSYDYFINCGFNAILDAPGATLEIVNGTALWNTCFVLGRMGGQCSFQSTIFTGNASGPRVNLNEYSVVRYSNTIFGSTNGSVLNSLLKTI